MEIEFKENLSGSFETVKINKGQNLVIGQGSDKDFVEEGRLAEKRKWTLSIPQFVEVAKRLETGKR